MSNKQMILLEREVRSREELAKAMKSGAAREFTREREALEKAVGGKAKLDKADQILADAERAYDNKVAAAVAKAALIVQEANEKAVDIRDSLEGEKADLAEQKRVLEETRVALSDRARELQDMSASIKAREAAVVQKEFDLDHRISEVESREATVLSREQKVEEVEKWLSVRP